MVSAPSVCGQTCQAICGGSRTGEFPAVSSLSDLSADLEKCRNFCQSFLGQPDSLLPYLKNLFRRQLQFWEGRGEDAIAASKFLHLVTVTLQLQH